MSDELILAVAGSGKSRRVIDMVTTAEEKIAVITYTISNIGNLHDRVIKRMGYIPPNVRIIPWFTFLLRHGIKPYANYVTDIKIRGVQFVQSQSAIKRKYKKPNGQTISVCYKEAEEFDKHYFNSKGDVFSDKLSKLLIRINSKSKGKVISRLEEIFDEIYIDEIQDFAANDLDVIKFLLESKINIKMVGDPRQVTYLTHYGRTYKKYREGKIAEFINEKCKNHKGIIDYETLKKSHRCHQEICDLASRIFPEYTPLESANTESTDHDGLFTVSHENIDRYIREFNPTQLRSSKAVIVNQNADVLNFGVSKGLTFDRVLIYPTKPIINWMLNNQKQLPFKSRCNLYVAITRARQSVCFVSNVDLPKTKRWPPPE